MTPIADRRARRFTIAFALALAAMLVCASSALAITRATVLARAQSWVDHPVTYSQSKYHLGYRTDCSGYVSMCWQTGTSWSTASFHAVTHRIATKDLKPGDALLKAGYHIRLFHNWVDAAHTRYVAYEAGTKVAVARIHGIADDLQFGYIPVRYNGVVDGPAPNNVIWNGSFDAWTQDYDGSVAPVMWQVDGARWQTVAVHRTDVAHSSKSSIELRNASDYHDDVTTLSQTASVTAGAGYRLTVWARTPSAPAALHVAVSYVGRNGSTLSSADLSAADFNVSGTAFAPISALSTAPAGTVNAIVSITLASGDGPMSAIVDDVSLVRPQLGVSLRASATSVRPGMGATLSGSVTPTAAAGANAAVYVKAPGGSWKRLSSAPIVSAGGSATYSARFVFARGLRKGVYQFRTSVGAQPGYLGATSAVAGVRLK